ncbi:uncharacterized protein BDZ99DRAFT_576907 [Mytilinidion resinicola]|uniref:Fungal N-terminal domain-containing protein n=1 Tax=Mytilinidion resinicola TaxID=574789 RepID=A0A6A6Y110_9PEZI|nr:uncharacterized protein BDZ99DRAFT_576907 [Mytilinidion resinicola]KAF2802203.1 hypothetical protein BDZ99DRAFT_576907 [Mytilinidion resinicola]
MTIDPGTALAIVSLGITVCDGISSYCNALKHRKEEVQSLSTISTELQSILQDVQTWLHSRPSLSDSLVNRVDGCVKTCLGHLDKILLLCTHYSPPAKDDLRSRIVYVSRGLQFPFKKATIQNLMVQMESLRSNVKLALTLLSSDFTFEGLEALKTLIQQSQQTTSHSIKTHVDEAELRLSNRLSSNEHHVRTDVQQLKQSISTEVQQYTQAATSSITVNMDQGFANLAQSSSNHMQHLERTVAQAQGSLSEEFNSGQQSLVTEIRELKYFLQLKMNSNLPQDSTNVISRSQSLLPRRRHRRKRPTASSEISKLCTCNATITESFFRSRSRKWFQKTSETCLVHAKDCPLWYTSQNKVTMEVNVRFWRLLVSGFIVLDSGYYSWRRWSVGLSPNLRCHTTVPSGSGVFAILESLRKTLKRSPNKRDREAALEECLAALHKLFSTGEASPHDVDEDGTNMLHFIASPPYYGSIFNVLGLVETLRFIEKIQSLWAVDLYSPRVYDPSGYARTPAGLLLEFIHFRPYRVEDANIAAGEFHFLLDWLIDYGFDVVQSIHPSESSLNYPWKDLCFVPMAQRPSVMFPLQELELIEATRCNSLSIAILKRDEHSMREELRKDPVSLSEVNYLGQNALHFATEWTEGLSILLESGGITDDILNQLDNYRRSALDYAALQDNMESVQMLIDADACFEFEDLETLNAISPNCRRLLISTLYERRRQLRDLAIEQRGSMDGDNAEHFGAFYTDTASRMYLLLLEETKVAVPESLRSSVLSEGSLYHWAYRDKPWYPFIRQDALQDLFAVGFVQVDEIWDQVTPIMTLQDEVDIIGLAEMLLENGADAEREFPLDHRNIQVHDDGRRHRGIHKLAFQIGKSRRNWMDQNDLLPSKIISQLSESSCVQRAIFQCTRKDPCSCYCSPGGCTALSCLMKGIRDSLRNRPASPLTLKPLAGALLQFDLGRRNGLIVAMEFIRMMTFDSLELTHTCCTYGEPGWNSPYLEMPRRRVEEQEEIDRIHEEETEGLKQLETLMEEFTKTFAESEIPLKEFFEGYWRERMEQEFYNNGPVPTEELEGQKEHCVWLREHSDLEHDFFAQLWVDKIHW